MTRVTCAVDGSVARIRLTRADAHNAIDPDWITDFAVAADAAGAAGARAVLISADGPSFTVGGDLAHLEAWAGDLSAELGRMIDTYHRSLAVLAALDVPVVCAVQGPAAGGGLGLLWCADVILAAEDLRIATGFARIGLSGDGGSSWALPRLVGPRRARQLLMHSRMLDAAEALEWGVVDRVVAVADLQREAEAEVQAWAAGPTLAFGHMKRLLRESPARTWPEQLDAERTAMISSGGTDDASEGIASFIERRPPRFEGR